MNCHPLEVLPGFGLFSVMFFRYDVCDIDFDTQAAVGIAVRPLHGGPGLVDTMASLKNEHLHSYVLSLPVSSQIAQVRGHDRYGFPKWVTDLEVDIDATRASARVANDDGGTDIALSAPAPTQTAHHSGEVVTALTSYTTISGAWQIEHEFVAPADRGWRHGPAVAIGRALSSDRSCPLPRMGQGT